MLVSQSYPDLMQPLQLVPVATPLQQPVQTLHNGRYVSEDVLGSGTYGVVMRCYDRLLNQRVALKVARPDPAYRLSAMNEARVLQLLAPRTKSVARITDVFEDNESRICIATELLSRNLYEVQRERGFAPLPIAHVRNVARSILLALVPLHQSGYMHCDLKPENVMCRTDLSDVCLIDFGAVRQFHENQYYDVQSLWYRAPEVLCGIPYSHKIDSWGLGCLLYELCVGSPLVPGEHARDQLERMFSIVGSPPQEYLLLGANVPALLPLCGMALPAESVSQQLFVRLMNTSCHAEADAAVVADLLSLLLCMDASRRISCADALQHPLFATTTTPPTAPAPPQAHSPPTHQPHSCYAALMSAPLTPTSGLWNPRTPATSPNGMSTAFPSLSQSQATLLFDTHSRISSPVNVERQLPFGQSCTLPGPVLHLLGAAGCFLPALNAETPPLRDVTPVQSTPLTAVNTPSYPTSRNAPPPATQTYAVPITVRVGQGGGCAVGPHYACGAPTATTGMPAVGAGVDWGTGATGHAAASVFPTMLPQHWSQTAPVFVTNQLGACPFALATHQVSQQPPFGSVGVPGATQHPNIYYQTGAPMMRTAQDN